MTPQDIFQAQLAMTPELHGRLRALLRVDGPFAFYATAPFAPMIVDHRPMLACLLEPVPHLDPGRMLDWNPDCDALLIEPESGRTTLVGATGQDDAGHIVGAALGDHVRLYTHGLLFARAWASSRLRWITERSAAMQTVPGLTLNEPANEGLPGVILAGKPDAVADWSAIDSAETVEIDVGHMVRPIADAFAKSRHLPRFMAAPPKLKVVA